MRVPSLLGLVQTPCNNDLPSASRAICVHCCSPQSALSDPLARVAALKRYVSTLNIIKPCPVCLLASPRSPSGLVSQLSTTCIEQHRH